MQYFEVMVAEHKCVCVSVCMCVKEKKREREREREKQKKYLPANKVKARIVTFISYFGTIDPYNNFVNFESINTRDKEFSSRR